MRHGQSTANVAGIILSDPADGRKPDYALTALGETQVRESVSAEKGKGTLDENTLIVSSPFSRCIRSAEIAKDILGVGTEVITDDRLGERWFGDLDKTSDQNYAQVWAEDRKSPEQTTAHVESIRSVQERVMAVMQDLESRYSDKTILLVSHGDTLQILKETLRERSADFHDGLTPLHVAEIQKIAI